MVREKRPKEVSLSLSLSLSGRGVRQRCRHWEWWYVGKERDGILVVMMGVGSEGEVCGGMGEVG